MLEAFEGSGKVPLEIESDNVESRAITPSPVDVGSRDRSFGQSSAAAWLGIDMRRWCWRRGLCRSRSSLSGGPKAKSAAASAGAFVVTTAQPRRITSFKFTAEDAARLRAWKTRSHKPEFGSEPLDNQALNVTACLIVLPIRPATGQETFAMTAFGSHVDGTFAVDLGGVRALVGAHTYRHAVSVFRANESGWPRGGRETGRAVSECRTVSRLPLRTFSRQSSGATIR